MAEGWCAPEGHGNHSNGNAAFTPAGSQCQAACTGVRDGRGKTCGDRGIYQEESDRNDPDPIFLLIMIVMKINRAGPTRSGSGFRTTGFTAAMFRRTVIYCGIREAGLREGGGAGGEGDLASGKNVRIDIKLSHMGEHSHDNPSRKSPAQSR